MNGCPDSDSDGVADNEDECPEEEVWLNLMDVPILILTVLLIKMINVPMNQVQWKIKVAWADSDGDGVSDNIDTCPERLVHENNGTL